MIGSTASHRLLIFKSFRVLVFISLLMAYFNDHSQQNRLCLPTELALLTLSQFYDFGVTNLPSEQDKYNAASSSFDITIASSSIIMLKYTIFYIYYWW